LTTEKENSLESIESSNTDEILQTMLNKNPKMKKLAEMLQGGKTIDANRQLEERYNDLQSENAKFRREYRVLVERNNLCSKALGLCAYCWGTDKNCECMGQGGPGNKVPDRESFEYLVFPALKKLGMSHPESFKNNKKMRESEKMRE